MTRLAKFGIVSATLLTMGFGAGSAGAFVARPDMAGASVESAVTPVAMCGRTCRNGGRYIPGPPQVCYDQGLEYCGSSRGGPGPAPGVGIGIPGTGIGVYVAPPQPNCRTFMVERPDGSLRRVTRCD